MVDKQQKQTYATQRQKKSAAVLLVYLLFQSFVKHKWQTLPELQLLKCEDLQTNFVSYDSKLKTLHFELLVGKKKPSEDVALGSRKSW